MPDTDPSETSLSSPGVPDDILRAEEHLIQASALLYSAEMLDMRASKGFDADTLRLIHEAREKIDQAMFGVAQPNDVRSISLNCGSVFGAKDDAKHA